MPELTSPFLQLKLLPQAGRFDILTADQSTPQILQAHCAVDIHRGLTAFSETATNWEATDFKGPCPEIFQPASVCAYRTALFSGQVLFEIEFVVPQNQAALLWRITITNTGPDSIDINRIDLLRAGGAAGRGQIKFQSQDLSFYKNGWQSWSHSGAYRSSQNMVRSRLGLLQNPMVLNHGTPALSMKGYFSSDFFAAINDLGTGRGLLLGFLSQRQHFGTIEALLYDQPSLTIWANGDHSLLAPQASQQTDWAVWMPLDLQCEDPLGPYLEAAAAINQVRLPGTVPAGWCSWYHYYTNLSAEDIRANLAAIQANGPRLPIDLVQIDDGFEAQVGDWFAFRPKFPHGVKPLAEEIRAGGKTPGLWLAPFIVHPKSRLEAEHPEYILRNEHGKPVNAGFVWNALTHGLDLTNPEALAYAKEVIATAAHEWGFPYLKLDFLYAAALPGRYQDPSRTRAQVLYAGMLALREAAGEDTFLLACGAPLGSVLGLVEANRIGADVSGFWRPNFNGIQFPFRNEPYMPSARNSIQNILTRSPLHNRWWVNDPDCLLVRPDTHLSLPEVQSLATSIAMTGGSLLLSDDLPALPENRVKIAQSLLPLTGNRAQVIDLFENTTPERLKLDCESGIGGWQVFARFNWSDKPLPWTFSAPDFQLPDQDYLAAAFWTDDFRTINAGVPAQMPDIPAHGVALYALYALKNRGQYAGSDLHFTQGCEITQWTASEDKIALQIQLQREDSGRITLRLPSAPMYASADGEAVRWQPAGNGFYHFYVTIHQSLYLEITLR